MPHKQIGVAQHAAEMLSDAGVQSVRSVARLDRWKSTEIIKRYYRTLSPNVLVNGCYVNIHCQTHLPKGFYPTNDRFDGAFRYVRVTVTPKDNR